jgi:hypothetical protein
MKVRTGFVSNSSSSSFVIFCKVPEDGKSITFDVSNIKKLHIISTKAALDKYFLSIYGGGDIDSLLTNEPDYIVDKYNKCLVKIKEGLSFFEGSVDYGDSDMTDFLKNLGADFSED